MSETVGIQGLIEEDATKVLREQRIEELKEYITSQETALTKFRFISQAD